jgi:hypothetical protein
MRWLDRQTDASGFFILFLVIAYLLYRSLGLAHVMVVGFSGGKVGQLAIMMREGFFFLDCFGGDVLLLFFQ